LLLSRVLAIAAACGIIATLPVGAAQDSTLRAVRGTIGYQATKDGPFTRVFGSFLVQDDQFAVTRPASNALLQLADSSEVALGQNTTIQVGQISQAATAAVPTTMTLVAGAIRFTVKHPEGSATNYRFQSLTSQLGVRGTTGLYSTSRTGDVVTCLDCAPGDVTVTAGGNSFPLLTGQTARISIGGIITIVATTAILATIFGQAGLSTALNAATPFAGGAGGGAAGAGGATGGSAGGAAGGGAAGGAATGVSAAAIGGAVAAAAVAAVAVTNANPTPSPSPTPTQAGTGSISGHAHANPAAIAPPTPAPQTLRTPAPSALVAPVPGRH
jgi:hypothetical protein